MGTLHPRHITRATARAHAAILRRKHPECRYVIRWVRNSRFHWHVIEIPRDDVDETGSSASAQ